jgi:ApbE superfamily uncharacterized protein (UPF0280 family)
MKNYSARTYRNLVKSPLKRFRVTVKETDILVYAHQLLEKEALSSVYRHRAYLEAYIEQYPDFLKTLRPWTLATPAAAIVRNMVSGGNPASVGPMAAVAGALAEAVGKDLLKITPEVIVENGGDIFIKTDHPLTVGIFAGKSPLNLKIGLKIDPTKSPVSVCTSSGTIGHSKSFGASDAVCVVADKCALADATATAVANRIHTVENIQDAIGFGKTIKGISGIVIIISKHLGVWGDLELVSLQGKKG